MNTISQQEETPQVNVSGTYKSNTGLFAGKFKGNVDLPQTSQPPIIPPTDPPIPPPEPPYDNQVAELLAIQIQNQGIVIQNQNQLIEGQKMDRIEYERNNPLINDNPLYDWTEATVPVNSMVTFTLAVPEGQVLFLQYWNMTFVDDSLYGHQIDGTGATTLPNLTEPLQDFGNHGLPFFNPPRLIYSHLILTATNLGDDEAVYGVFLRGFFRQTTKLNPEYQGAR